MMPDVPLHPRGIPLQELNEQTMMMDKGTCWAYISDSLTSFCWCLEHKPGWLTAYAQNKVILLKLEAAGIGTREEKIVLENDLLNCLLQRKPL
jgi:hypothetical protein